MQWSPGQFKSGKCRKFEQWYFLESVNAVLVTRWRQGERPTTGEASSWLPEGDALRREISNWKFQISNEAKAKRKNVKPAALKGGATKATAKSPARRRRYEKQTWGARSKLMV